MTSALSGVRACDDHDLEPESAMVIAPRRDVGFDDAERICRLLQRANVHRDMRPYGSGHVPHQRRAAGIGVGEEHSSPIQHRGEGSPLCRRDPALPSERLGKITSEGRLETQHRCATRMTSLPNLPPSRKPTNARGAFSSDMGLWNTVQPPSPPLNGCQCVCSAIGRLPCAPLLRASAASRARPAHRFATP